MHAILWFAILLSAPTTANTTRTIFTPLLSYQGSWHVTRKSGPSGAKPELLTDQCSLFDSYFVCQQTINGQVGALLIFVVGDRKGAFHTQTIMPDGRATGRSDLEISGNQWTYLSRWQQGGGKVTYYKTTNTFLGSDRIHFEQAESPDGVHWTTKDSGEEVRVKSGSIKESQ